MEISSSRQFLEWLVPQRISLVVSTYQTGKIIFLGTNEFGQLSAFQRLFNRAMGLYATTERLYLSCKYQLWQLDNALLPGQVHKGYDKLYVPRIGYTTGDIDVHDVAVDGEGKVIFVSTLLNCLATLSDSHSCKPLWKPPFISRIVGEDRCHLYGLAMVDGKPGYVTACSRSDIVDGWRDRKVGGGVVIDVASNEIICTGLVMPHSPRWYKGKLWLHNSGRGELGYVDLTTGKFEAIAFCPGYLRGLAFWEDYAILGLSKPRGGDGTFSGLPLDDLLEEKDAEARCGLMVVNLNTGTIAHWVRFEGNITELYDVQIIPGVKRPMALGFQTEEISGLITLEQNEGVKTKEEGRRKKEEDSNVEKLKVISFSLWGDNPKYTLGAIKNADLAPKIYPGWICRFYINDTVPQNIIDDLATRDWVEIIKIDQKHLWQGLFWRFYPAADPDVAVMISRDTDSRLNQREKAAVDEWLLSDKQFHIMRDHPRHTVPILGGMWGIKSNGLNMVKLIDNYLNNDSSIDIQYGIDQHFLATVIYPQIKERCLVHDEIFQNNPFPLPRNNYEYVGQIFFQDESTSIATDDILKQHLLSKKQNNIVNSSVEYDSNTPQVLLKRSRGFKKSGNLEQAEFCLRQAILLKPDYWVAYNNLGTLLQNQENIVEAKQCYEKAIELNPYLAEAISNLASIWQVEEDFERAKTGFYRALQLKPDYIPAHLNLARIFNKKKRLLKAVEHFEKVIDLDSNHKEAYSGLAMIYDYHNKLAEALHCYEQLERLEPDNKYIKAYITNIHFKQCNWQDYNRRIKELIASLETHLGNPTDDFLSPFALSALPVSLQQHQALATAKAKEISFQVAEIKQRLQFKFSKNQPQKLRIGYISPDFREHAVGRLIYQIFQYHNRNQFEIYAYHTVDVDDYITQQVRQGCDVFVDISSLSSEAAAKRIYGDGVHILIDLAGYTIDNATTLALQPAPIQAQWLGYPNTMGADFIQYYLGDRTLITPEIAQHYTEEIIYLPHAFVASPLPISDKPMTRAEFGLPEDAFVFCCFNAHYKITPELFDVWMRILEQVPNGVLWLASGSGVENLRSEAKKRSFNVNRLIFAEKIPHDEYLARYRLADLYLDTFIYNAGSTAAAVLQSGLPLLTCCGNSNASRMGASICTAAGLESTICNTADEYEQKAVYLATHRKELSQIRLSLEEKLQCQTTYPSLFRVEEFVLTLESAFEQMWQKFVTSN